MIMIIQLAILIIITAELLTLVWPSWQWQRNALPPPKCDCWAQRIGKSETAPILNAQSGERTNSQSLIEWWWRQWVRLYNGVSSQPTTNEGTRKTEDSLCLDVHKLACKNQWTSAAWTRPHRMTLWSSHLPAAAFLILHTARYILPGITNTSNSNTHKRP